nr:nuclear pore complex protein Nup54 [Hymenolepis microstoma]
MFGNTSKSLFGAPQNSGFGTSTTQGGLSFGAAAAPASNTFSFGAKPATTSAFTLGASTAKSTTNIFGGLNTATTSTASPFSFSTAAAKPASLFGNTFGSNTTSSTPGSLFSFQPAQTTQTTFGFKSINGSVSQSTAEQQQQLQARQSVDAFYASLSQPVLFGDERDNVVARLNQLQAILGMGTGFSALGTVNYSPDNPFSRFRGIAYNVLPTSSEADGLVCMELNKNFNDVIPQKQAIQDHIFRLLGGRPNLQLTIEEIRPCARSGSSTEIVVKVVERQASGTSHTIPASDLANFFCGATVKPQLESQLLVCRLMPELAPSASQINAYLEIPPAGFDKRVWQQAREENPAPNRLIPVPVIGFADLKRRRDEQLLFGEQQRKSVKQLLSVATNLQTQQLSSTQKLSEIKRKQIELNHRVLKLLAKQTVSRRAGFAISAEEEALRCALEHTWAEIAGPRGLRARIQQLLPSVRSSKTSANDAAKKQQSDGSDGCDFKGGAAAWWQHPDVVDDLKEYLTQRTVGIKEMRRLLTELNSVVRILSEKRAKTPNEIAAVTRIPVVPPFGVKSEPAL